MGGTCLKRRTKALLLGLAVPALLVAGLAWQQRDNLKALGDALRFTPEELEQQMAENQQRIRDAVDAAPDVAVRDVTEEERQALRDGSLSQEELVERLLEDGQTDEPGEALPASGGGQAVPETGPADSGGGSAGSGTGGQTGNGQSGQTAGQESAADSGYQRELSALVAKVLVLREQYTMALETMYDEARAEYHALPEDQRSKSDLMALARSYISRASDLEKECDGQMDEIVSAMEALLQENGGDMSLVDTVVYTYANEKSLKKSWYLSELERRGLV